MLWMMFLGCAYMAVLGLALLVFGRLCDLSDGAPRARKKR